MVFLLNCEYKNKQQKISSQQKKSFVTKWLAFHKFKDVAGNENTNSIMKVIEDPTITTSTCLNHCLKEEGCYGFYRKTHEFCKLVNETIFLTDSREHVSGIDYYEIPV